MSTRREDLAWAAGLFEGEGHWRRSDRLRNGYRWNEWSASIQMQDVTVLQRFLDVVGIGRIRGPYPMGHRRFADLHVVGYSLGICAGSHRDAVVVARCSSARASAGRAGSIATAHQASVTCRCRQLPWRSEGLRYETDMPELCA